MFDMEKEIRKWLNALRRNSSIEDGDLAELESHLRDDISRRTAAGAGDEEAFRAALKESTPADILGAEFEKSRPRRGQRSASPKSWIFLSGLFPSYFKLALRRMARQKGYSLINVMALAVGLTACGLMLLFVRFEASVDTYHEDIDRIFRVGLYRKSSQGVDVIGGNYSLLAPTLKEQFPQVE
jgi:hypothetical protein